MRAFFWALVAFLAVSVAACGNPNQRLLDSRAQRDASMQTYINNSIKYGVMTPQEGQQMMNDAHAWDAANDQRRQNEAATQVIINAQQPQPITASYQQPSSGPIFTSSAPPAYSQPTDPCSVMSCPTYQAPSVRYIPYSGVAPLMPGIRPDGTAH